MINVMMSMGKKIASERERRPRRLSCEKAGRGETGRDETRCKLWYHTIPYIP